MMYKEFLMQRTQIYFEEDMFEELKQKAAQLGISVSAYIRSVLKKELKKEKKEQQYDFSEFAGMWKDRTVNLADIREKAWK